MPFTPETPVPAEVDTWHTEQLASDEYTVESLNYISVEDLDTVIVENMVNAANPFTAESPTAQSPFTEETPED